MALAYAGTTIIVGGVVDLCLAGGDRFLYYFHRQYRSLR